MHFFASIVYLNFSRIFFPWPELYFILLNTMAKILKDTVMMVSAKDKNEAIVLPLILWQEHTSALFVLSKPRFCPMYNCKGLRFLLLRVFL